MPLYQILDIDTNEETEILLSWDELQIFLKDNPTKQYVPGRPSIISGLAERHKVDDNFKDLLKNMKKNNPGSTMDV